MDPQQQAIAEEFDRYNESYDDAVNRAISFSGQKVESFSRAKADDLLRTIAAHFGSPCRLSLLRRWVRSSPGSTRRGVRDLGKNEGDWRRRH